MMTTKTGVTYASIVHIIVYCTRIAGNFRGVLIYVTLWMIRQSQKLMTSN